MSSFAQMKLWFVVGTAAELIKIYPVIREAARRGAQWKIVSTGHSPVELVRQAADFEISPADLIAPVKSSRDSYTSAAVLKWFTKAWRTTPTWWDSGSIVVNGDTLSTVIGAHWGETLAADIIHIEAGIRSPHLLSPFPEEISRRLVSKLARFHVATSAKAVSNLRESGIANGIVQTEGSTLADAIRLYARPDRPEGELAMVNVQRNENLRSSKRWDCILETIELASNGRPLLWVLHPRTKKKIRPSWRAKMESSGVTFVERLPYSEFIRQLSEAAFLISDGAVTKLNVLTSGFHV